MPPLSLEVALGNPFSRSHEVCHLQQEPKRIAYPFPAPWGQEFPGQGTVCRCRTDGCFGMAGLTHADQRITEDVEKFCFAVADLYSYTFKPLLDVALFTRSLAKSMGYRTQLALYAYYLASAALLRALSPPLALMTAQETGLVGAFRSAHQVSNLPLWVVA